MKYNFKGSNQFKDKPKFLGLKRNAYLNVLVLGIFIALVVIIGKNFRSQELKTISYAQTANKFSQQISQLKEINKYSNPQDIWIFQYATQFQKPEIGKSVSLLRYQLACLAHKENGYHANNNCGDGGLACGMYQYHPETYTGFRKIMMSEGLTDHVGSRLNDQDAIQTTAYALTHGLENNWGPIARGMCF